MVGTVLIPSIRVKKFGAEKFHVTCSRSSRQSGAYPRRSALGHSPYLTAVHSWASLSVFHGLGMGALGICFLSWRSSQRTSPSGEAPADRCGVKLKENALCTPTWERVCMCVNTGAPMCTNCSGCTVSLMPRNIPLAQLAFGQIGSPRLFADKSQSFKKHHNSFVVAISVSSILLSIE